MIVVEFQKYRGQSWMESHPTWVPIPVNEARCEDNCCTRTGFPLIPAYGISIFNSIQFNYISPKILHGQGVTV